MGILLFDFVRTVLRPGQAPKQYRPLNLSISVVCGTPNVAAAFLRDIAPDSTILTAFSNFNKGE